MDAVIDPAALSALDEDAGIARAREVLAGYLATLEERVYMLRGALAAYDSASALVILRGLRGASAMVGARRLAELADSLDPALRRGNFRPARDALPQLLELVSATRAELTRVMEGRPLKMTR